MNFTTENIAQFSLRIKQKTILTIVVDITTYRARLKTEAKITNLLRLRLKRPTKLTKENFAENGLAVLITFC